MKALIVVLITFIFGNLFSQNTSVIRTFTKENNKLKVELTIYNSKSGFALLRDIKPKGYKVERGEIDENVSFIAYENRQVKFSWDNIPQLDSLKVNYYVTLSDKDDFDDFISNVSGRFYYLCSTNTTCAVAIKNKMDKSIFKLLPTKGSKQD